MFIIWHDRDYDFGRWVYLNSILQKKPEKTLLRDIPKNNTKNVLLNSLKEKSDFCILPFIKYETPDIIIQHINDDNGFSEILNVTEFMTHTPQHHHPLQRFSRIYGASQLKIPTSLVIPKTKTKLERREGVYKPTKYKTNPLIYHIFLKATYTYNIPVLLFLWSEKDGYLKYDKKHPTAPFIDDQINRWFYLLDKCIENCNNDFLKDVEVDQQLKLMKKNSNYVDRTYSEFFSVCETLYKLETIRIKNTQEVIEEFGLDQKKLSEIFLKNEKTLIFEPGGLRAPSTPFRTDPYAGMLCAFDILFCRDDEGRRATNLVLKAKNIKYGEISVSKTKRSPTFQEIDHDIESCPFISLEKCRGLSIEQIKEHLDNCPFTQSKQRRIYGEVADIIIFDDHVYYKG